MLHLSTQGNDITCEYSAVHDHRHTTLSLCSYHSGRLSNACRHVDLHRGRRWYHRRMPAESPTTVQDRRSWFLVAAAVPHTWIIQGAFEQRKHRHYKLEWEQEFAKGSRRFLRCRRGYRGSSVQHHYRRIGKVRFQAG